MRSAFKHLLMGLVVGALTAPAALAEKSKPTLHFVGMADTADWDEDDGGIAIDVAVDLANALTLAEAAARLAGMKFKAHIFVPGGQFPPANLPDTDEVSCRNAQSGCNQGISSPTSCSLENCGQRCLPNRRGKKLCHLTTLRPDGRAKHPKLKGKKFKKLSEIMASASVHKDKFNRKGTKRFLKTVKTKRDDAVWFHYVGHGFRWADQPFSKRGMKVSRSSNAIDHDVFPALWLEASNDPDYKSSIQLTEIFELIEKKNPRLTIVISDSCNEILDEMPKELKARYGARGSKKTALNSAFKRLFREAKGHILIGSSEPGIQAQGDDIIGGVFTFTFLDHLVGLSIRKGKKISWDEIITKVNKPLTRKTRHFNDDKDEHGVSTGEWTPPQRPQIDYEITYGAGSKSEQGKPTGSASAGSGVCSIGKPYSGKPKCACPKGTTLRSVKTPFKRLYVCAKAKTASAAGTRQKTVCPEGIPKDGACVIGGGQLPREYGRCEKGKKCRCTIVSVPRQKGQAAIHCLPKGKTCPRGWKRSSVRSLVKVLGKKHRFSIATCTWHNIPAKRAAACKAKPDLTHVRMSANLLKKRRKRVKPKGFLPDRNCPYWIDSKKLAVFAPAAGSKATGKAKRGTRKASRKARKKSGKKSWINRVKKKKKRTK